jgi:hypothetical protein
LAQSGRSGGHGDRVDIEKFPSACVWDLKTEILAAGWLPPKV